MSSLQRQFEKFHQNIKLERFKENNKLREKRDIILDKLRNRIKIVFEDMDEAVPAWDWFNQGSYEMGTGIKPLNGGDYDIDIGVYFELDVDKYKDPVEVKQWVCKALDGHTNSVDIKEPCVRVEYSVGGEPKYHVDLAIYGYEEGIILSDTYQLARGKLNFIMDK